MTKPTIETTAGPVSLAAGRNFTAADWADTIAEAANLTGQHRPVFDMTKDKPANTFEFHDAGVMQPGARITELESWGFRFLREYVTAPDSQGRLKRIKQYLLQPSSWLDFALAKDLTWSGLRIAGNHLERLFKTMVKVLGALTPAEQAAFDTLRESIASRQKARHDALAGDAA